VRVKSIAIAAVIALNSLVVPSLQAAEVNAFLKHSWIDGANRVCVYNALGREYYITIRSTQICKLSIKFNQK
jgi:hypothetical protein